jgi:protocatechuate 3,4-dioxygenase beta subunit
MRRVLCSLFGLIVWIAGAAPASGHWNVRGKVLDQHGEPVAGAAVKLKAETAFQIRSSIATSEGEYSFRGLNTNFDYTVQARHSSGNSRVQRLSRFQSKEDHVVNLTIIPNRPSKR